MRYIFLTLELFVLHTQTLQTPALYTLYFTLCTSDLHKAGSDKVLALSLFLECTKSYVMEQFHYEKKYGAEVYVCLLGLMYSGRLKTFSEHWKLYN